MQNKTGQKTRRLVALALFAALAYVCVMLLHIKVSFLTFDAKDAFLTVAGMCFGPVAAAILSLLVALLEFVTISSTGLYGLLMNFVASAAFSVPASWIYKRHKTMNGAVCGLLCGVVSMTGVMMLMNLLITPYFMKCDIGTVLKMIPTLLLPFNLIKAVLNAALVLVLYKPITMGLRQVHLMEGTTVPYRFGKRSAVVLTVGLLLIVLCVVLFLMVLQGNILFGN